MEQENLEEVKEREERLAQIEVKYILKVNPMLVFQHSVWFWSRDNSRRAEKKQ